MNRTRVAIMFTVLAVMLAGVVVHAAEPVRIATLDIKRCMEESKKGKQLKGELRVRVEQLDKAAKPLEEEARSIASDMERQGSLLSETLKKEKQQRFMEIRDELKKIDRDKKDVAEELSEAVLKDLEKVVLKVAEEGGYDMIISKGGPWLLYSKKELDVTEEVIRRYDEMMGE